MHRALVVLFALASCSGPAASDAAICRDTIHRLCIAPVCDEVTAAFSVTAANCEATMLAHAGCASEAFMFTPMFTSIDRGTWLNCRTPLLRNGDSIDVAPDCLDVSDTFIACPGLVQFLGGVTVLPDGGSP
jgi:hypothetical protein